MVGGKLFETGPQLSDGFFELRVVTLERFNVSRWFARFLRTSRARPPAFATTQRGFRFLQFLPQRGDVRIDLPQRLAEIETFPTVLPLARCGGSFGARARYHAFDGAFSCSALIGNTVRWLAFLRGFRLPFLRRQQRRQSRRRLRQLFPKL